ncbi:MAG: TolC family protein [Bacteroidales bacterium]|nr:TolC family protein [Bacteroidales bacterium]
MKKTILSLFAAAFLAPLAGQDTLTLFMCDEAAISNYPLSKQKEILDKSYHYTLSSLSGEFLPSATLNGQAHYQSDVTKMPFEAPPGLAIEELENDWYKATLDVNQLIYDGGYVKGQKEVENLAYKSSLNDLEVELYGLRERVNQAYFAILMLREKKGILELQAGILESDLDEINVMVKNGVTLASNENRIKAELLNLNQSSADLMADLGAMYATIRELTGLNCSRETHLELPFIYFKDVPEGLSRPEYELFSTQQQILDARGKLLGSRLLPRLYGFGQAGYGRPGLDMLKNSFSDFYTIGARLSWKFWDWEQTKNEREILKLKKDIVQTHRETFDKNLKISAVQKRSEIDKIENSLRKDEEIILLRESITRSSSAQLRNGIITSSDYVAELNSEMVARMNHEIHKIQLARARAEYLTLTGNIDKY